MHAGSEGREKGRERMKAGDTLRCSLRETADSWNSGFWMERAGGSFLPFLRGILSQASCSQHTVSWEARFSVAGRIGKV